MQIYAITEQKQRKCGNLFPHLHNLTFSMDTTINDRVKIIIDQLFNGNASEFSRVTGIKRSTLSTILGPRNSAPSYEAIYAIADSINEDIFMWLIKGNGDIPKNYVNQENKYGDNVSGKNGVYGNRMNFSAPSDCAYQKIINENGIEITYESWPSEYNRLQNRITELSKEVESLIGQRDLLKNTIEIQKQHLDDIKDIIKNK